MRELKRLNALTADRIYPGQELQLGVKQTKPLDIYTVRKGDYLGRIARLHQMSVADLKRVNNLKTYAIYPGEKLKVSPFLRRSREWLKIREINWDDLKVLLGGVKKIEAGNGPYYNMRPKAARQSTMTIMRTPANLPCRTIGKREGSGRLSNTKLLASGT